MIGGKWKILVLWHVAVAHVIRFGELRRKLPGITERTLTLQLRELERAGLIDRKVCAQVPPKTEYRLTKASEDLQEVYQALLNWGTRHKDSFRDLSAIPQQSLDPKWQDSYDHLSSQRRLVTKIRTICCRGAGDERQYYQSLKLFASYG